MQFVLSDQMLDEVVLAVANMGTVLDITLPPFQVAMSFVFMSHPIRLSLERLGIRTVGKGAREGLDILVYMLCPI